MDKKQTRWHVLRLKAWLIYNILRGRPAMYRFTIRHAGLSFDHPDNQKGIAYESHFLADPTLHVPSPEPAVAMPVHEPPWWERTVG